MELLKSFLGKELGISDESTLEKFLLFDKLLMEWNSKINLVSRNTVSIESHVLNSIFFLTKYKIPENSRIVDIGTGGGFPGIPLKILRNDLDILLIDSIIKKTTAVKDIIENLGLNDIDVLSGRAETISSIPSYKKKFDIVIAKSVATLDKLFSWTADFLKESGEMVFIKGGDISDELKNLKKKNKNMRVEITEYSFDPVYKIEDKKIVSIKKNK